MFMIQTQFEYWEKQTHYKFRPDSFFLVKIITGIHIKKLSDMMMANINKNPNETHMLLKTKNLKIEIIILFLFFFLNAYYSRTKMKTKNHHKMK